MLITSGAACATRFLLIVMVIIFTRSAQLNFGPFNSGLCVGTLSNLVWFRAFTRNDEAL